MVDELNKKKMMMKSPKCLCAINHSELFIDLSFLFIDHTYLLDSYPVHSQTPPNNKPIALFTSSILVVVKNGRMMMEKKNRDGGEMEARYPSTHSLTHSFANELGEFVCAVSSLHSFREWRKRKMEKAQKLIYVDSVNIIWMS